MRGLRHTVATETDECVTLADWLSAHRVVFTHVANERVVGKGGAALGYLKKLLRMGMQKGFPDFIIFDHPPARPELKGTIIEMKSAHGRTQPEQHRWLQKLENRGYYTTICYSADEAIRLLINLEYHRLNVVKVTYKAR